MYFRTVYASTSSKDYREGCEDVLKELSVSIMCGNWNVTLTSFRKDRIDPLDWASGVTQNLKAELSFVKILTKRMVMPQIWSRKY